jgi:hypothetical protein
MEGLQWCGHMLNKLWSNFLSLLAYFLYPPSPFDDTARRFLQLPDIGITSKNTRYAHGEVMSDVCLFTPNNPFRLHAVVTLTGKVRMLVSVITDSNGSILLAYECYQPDVIRAVENKIQCHVM